VTVAADACLGPARSARDSCLCYRGAMRRELCWMVVAVVVAAAGCGDGGGSSGGSSGGISGGGGSGGGSLGPSWTQGVFQASSTFANQCASPRTGIDPSTGRRYPDVQGSTLTENNYLRSWTNELYLWYSEVPDVNPASYSSTSSYFNVLKTTATTPSGRPKDRFHFTYSTAEWQALSQSGVAAGYGAEFVIIASTPPRNVVVAYTEPGSPATTAPATLARGAKVLTVDGVDLVNATDSASVAKLNEGLFPSSAGASHTFSVLDAGATAPRTITMVSANVTSTPVQNVGTIRTASGTVGYMLFNDHIATAEQGLVNAFRQLSDAKINELVIDLRYNGGGYLDIASEVGYMIAGPGNTTGRTFEKTVFNDKHTTKDPVTGQPLTPVPFHSTAQGLSVPDGQPLPTLNLSRVTVLTGGNTCSASESIINGLLGVGVEVIQIGATSCGKPYGFYPQDNCGTTYFSIQFKGINDKGFGDYPDGFSPANATGSIGVQVPGCAVADDFNHALGDPKEARLEAALGYLVNRTCPAASALPSAVEGGELQLLGEGSMHKSPFRENRILRR
jgi:C-terminal processing protease CtpA/Prc